MAFLGVGGLGGKQQAWGEHLHSDVISLKGILTVSGFITKYGFTRVIIPQHCGPEGRGRERRFKEGEEISGKQRTSTQKNT